MVDIIQGNILRDDSEALVNTVNCVGVMGKGIALQFKQAFPENFTAYRKTCEAGDLNTGKMFVYKTQSMINPLYIINFPTKKHWKGKSKISDIEAGLDALIQVIKDLEIKSIAVPPLGCGNGGLSWGKVRPLIEQAFAELSDVTVHLYEPVGSPKPENMPIGTPIPEMTRARALFIKLIELYSLPGYKLSNLEIQKLAYFLQEAGEHLRLRFQKQKYGPYAENLNHVLQVINGHFIQGYGDRSHDAELYLLPNAIQQADNFLNDDTEAKNRLEKIQNLVKGFETPYGMELLSSVHWVAKYDAFPATNEEEAIIKINEWNERKSKLLKKEHIKKAWQHLEREEWFS